MTPRAQGQEKMNSVPCLRHAPSECASSTLPGGVSNPLYQGCRLHLLHTAPPSTGNLQVKLQRTMVPDTQKQSPGQPRPHSPRRLAKCPRI